MRWKLENRDRNFRILRLRHDGWNLREIGGMVGLSKERVRQILAEHKWMQARHPRMIARIEALHAVSDG